MGLPPMQDFTALCEELFPEALGIDKDEKRSREGGRFALMSLLRSIGLPDTLGNPSSEEVAGAIIAAMTARSWTRLHMCPLDLAGELPPLDFGPCMIREFARQELEEVLQIGRLRRQVPNLNLDTAGLADFRWLVVREEIPVIRAADARAFPWFDFRMDRDFGAIDPHPRAWPPILERAVFGLTLLPWEEMVADPRFEWRGFRIPWIHTVDHDPFTSARVPQGPDTLTRQPVSFTDRYTGEEVELEKPIEHHLRDDLDTYWRLLDGAWWTRLEQTIASPIVNPLVAHFGVRAFRSEGIDEFLGQMVAIEAAIGMARDHNLDGPRPKVNGKNEGAKTRVAKRAAAITHDPAAEVDYVELFHLRSAFIHGRPLQEISSEKRLVARRLARRVMAGLLDVAGRGLHRDRKAFLTSLCP